MFKTQSRFAGCLLAVSVSMLAVSTASAQYSSNFEDLDASAGGTLLTGQDGYYIPDGTDSVDFYAYKYTGNTLGIPKNPLGGAQFVAGVGPGSPTFARAQRDIAWGTGIWEVTYDVCPTYLGTGESQDNLGSFSVQPYPGSASYIHLFSFMDPTNPVAWRTTFNLYDENGLGKNGVSPGPEWDNLQLDRWYRLQTIIDFNQNRIVELRITDMATRETSVSCQATWYLEGGSGGGLEPTGFRMFAGGGVTDNCVAWDNMSIQPAEGQFYLCADGDCPGYTIITISGATANGNVAVVASTKAGPFTNPNNPCIGITIDLSPPFLPGFPMTLKASAQGKIRLTGTVPKALCGKLLLQAVDLTTCTTSNLGSW